MRPEPLCATTMYRSAPCSSAPSGAVVAAAGNERERAQDPTAHAELLALRRAAQTLGSWRLTDHTLVVTLEPCTMCAGALVLARVARLIFGAYDPKAGAVASLWDVVRDPASIIASRCAEASSKPSAVPCCATSSPPAERLESGTVT